MSRSWAYTESAIVSLVCLKYPKRVVVLLHVCVARTFCVVDNFKKKYNDSDLYTTEKTAKTVRTDIVKYSGM